MKLTESILLHLQLLSPPAREVWVEISAGEKLLDNAGLSPPAREVWVEIYITTGFPGVFLVASREGGVG